MKIGISAADSGQCIREFLQKRFAISSRCLSALKSKADGITVNGEKRTVRYLLQQGDELCLLLGDGEGDAAPPATTTGAALSRIGGRRVVYCRIQAV